MKTKSAETVATDESGKQPAKAESSTNELDHTQGVPSRAAIKGHPLHPAVIVFPIAFLIGAFLTDLAFWKSRGVMWASFSYWLLLAGVVGGTVAAALGAIDFLSIDRARMHRAGWVHAGGNVLVLVLSLTNWFLRIGDVTAHVLPFGLILSAITSALLALTGYLGGELVFKHMIGVTGHGGSSSSAEHHH
ncbi:MAG TPA: DUF2231 domain-containing protein [Thermoanaerobaculia bacterium]|nr:DUF2231 domain-containing protein [Thermoanaerobaculia bacterium]